MLINHEICITNLCFVQITSESYNRFWYQSKPGSVAQCEFFSKHLEDAETRGGWIGVASFKFSNLFTQQRQSVWQRDGRSTLSNIIWPSLCFSHLVVVDHKRFFQSNLIKRVTCSFRKTQQIPSSLILKLQLKSFELHQPSLLHIRCSRLYVKYILLSSRFKYVMLSWGLSSSLLDFVHCAFNTQAVWPTLDPSKGDLMRVLALDFLIAD